MAFKTEAVLGLSQAWRREGKENGRSSGLFASWRFFSRSETAGSAMLPMSCRWTRNRSNTSRTSRSRTAFFAEEGCSYLVDPASSHMLVSKIKPCMSKYKLLHSETANGSLNQLWFLRSYNPTWITVVILELIHAIQLRPSGKSAFIRSRPIGSQGPSHW